jgi:hypothetical protein
MATKQWHQILGELRSMAPGLPGARGLFSALQEALQHKDGQHRLPPHAARLCRHRRLPSYCNVPCATPHSPAGVSPCLPLRCRGVLTPAASGWVASGYDLLDASTHPIIWRAKFPPMIQSALTHRGNNHMAHCPSVTSNWQGRLLIKMSLPALATKQNGRSGSVVTMRLPSHGQQERALLTSNAARTSLLSTQRSAATALPLPPALRRRVPRQVNAMADAASPSLGSH